MKALVLDSKENFAVKEIEKPTFSEGQVLVRVSYVGVCGSDLARYFEGKVHNYPVVLGHEFSGVVEQVGPHVRAVKEGDRVAVAPLVPCGVCENCERGKPALCDQYSFVGSRQQGAMAEYVAVDEKNVLVLPDEVSNEEAALIEPLTVAIHGIERIQFSAGAHVVVFGAGTIGIMTLLALKARGAGNVTVIDINDEKLERARGLGASTIINSLKTDLNEYFSLNPKPEAVIETAGVSQTQVQSVEIVEKLGKVVYVGTATRDVVFPAKVFERILRGEIEITGSWMSYSAPFPGFEWRAALQYIKEGVINVKPLINEVYRLEDKEAPFVKMRDPQNHSIKFLYEIG
ncbi:galactitol-1-phosphate 5-dehydrogenase [Domibacillus enclensis]|uniref:Galactitol-1-phosphate 5-dehydrogenase n=1 Tax=Domibacillus enclensis TaxID=1017273 RepID=A0A1N6V5Q2_9BACI|nr:galactitol-1-phosphate 5-dehydrogenase [Domibacillus enclensis]OXS78705.1 galactitol-1-phosphate 5-dehydrogenase [Domibacillus enclensis]SIQ73211.1 L-iditol 2-dehydrogenase/galactitol-1-phosphate 5-dehydrogenase [Domibacillus enclensis]